ncbi:MAG: MATE family efflux transporter [Anaerovorax sp.]
MKNEKDVQVLSDSEFATKPIVPLLWKYALLGLFGLVLQASSVIADGIFVGAGVGAMGLATIGIIAPLWTITVAFVSLFGSGGATVAAVKKGNGDLEGAAKVYNTVIVSAFAFAAMLSLLALIFLDELLLLLGATTEIMPNARAYALPYFIGFPFCIAGSTACAFARIDERPLAAAITLVLSSLTAITTEYIMLVKLNWGMEGAAIPWVICVGGPCIIFVYLQAKSSLLKLSFRNLKPDFSILWKAVKIGFPFFAMPICATAATILINNLIVNYDGGEINVAAFGIINAYVAYILSIFGSTLTGGMQPIASYNMGAKLYLRVKKVLEAVLVQSTAIMAVAVLLVLVFAKNIVIAFAGNDPVLVPVAVDIIRVYLLLYAVGNISQIAAGYFQSVERTGLALLNGISKIIIFTVPICLILSSMMGVQGIWIAQPIADALAGALGLFLILKECRYLGKLHKTEGVLA